MRDRHNGWRRCSHRIPCGVLTDVASRARSKDRLPRGPTSCAANMAGIAPTTICSTTISTSASIRRRRSSAARTRSASRCSRTTTASNSTCIRSLDVDKILLGDDRAEVRARHRRGLRRFSGDAEAGPRRTRSTSITPASRCRHRQRSAASPSARIRPASPGLYTACEGVGASIWWPNKDQWRDEVETAWRSASRFPTIWSTSPTASSSARPTSATATRAGIGSCTTPSTTTTCR